MANDEPEIRIDKERIREAAINLIKAFDSLPPEAENIRGWRRTYHALIERALNGEINDAVSSEDKDVPGVYFELEGGFRDYPYLQKAISRFRIEVEGKRELYEKYDADFEEWRRKLP